MKMADATIIFKIVYLHYLVQETAMDIKESLLMRYCWVTFQRPSIVSQII